MPECQAQTVRRIFSPRFFPLKRGPYRRVERSISPVARGEMRCASRHEDLTLLPWIFQLSRRRALARSLAVSWQQADLEHLCLPQAQYDLIVNFNYLQRSLIPQIYSALNVGGLVIFDTYLIDQKEIGHPKNPEYLLAHNELLKLFRSCRVLYYREGKFVDAGESSFRAGILAQKVG
jgi:hypothetical protein